MGGSCSGLSGLHLKELVILGLGNGYSLRRESDDEESKVGDSDDARCVNRGRPNLSQHLSDVCGRYDHNGHTCDRYNHEYLGCHVLSWMMPLPSDLK